MDEIYDQDLDTAEVVQPETKEAQASQKDSQKPQEVSEAKAPATPDDEDVKLSKEEYSDFKRMQQATNYHRCRQILERAIQTSICKRSRIRS